MVIIDPRAGSRNLAQYEALEGIHRLDQLEFGDVMLTGHGPNDSTLTIGVEVKSAYDMLSSMGNGRLQAQAEGMLKTYDHSWLLVFGAVRSGKDNYMEINRYGRWQHFKLGRHLMPWSYLEGFLLTLQLFTPVRVKWCYNEEEAAKWIAVLDKWLSKKWTQHKGLQVFNTAGKQAAPVGADPVEKVMAEMAARIPGVGWTRGWGAAKHFNSVEEMINAPASEWEKIPKMGPVLSKSVRNTIRRMK